MKYVRQNRFISVAAFMLFIFLTWILFKCNHVTGKKSTIELYQIVDSSNSKELIDKKSRIDTQFTNVYLENTPTIYGKFGMTITEWNRNLAQLAKDGVIEEIQEDSIMNYYEFDDTRDDIASTYLHDGKTVYYGKKNLEKSSVMKIVGVFKQPKNYDNEHEVFLRDGKTINEGILTGIRFTFDIPTNRINKIYDNAISNDNLVYIAGTKIPQIRQFQISINELRERYIPIKEKLVHFAENTPNYRGHEHDIDIPEIYRSIYSGQYYYSVFSLYTYIIASVRCDTNCQAISIIKAEKEFHPFEQVIYSKLQSGVIENDYLSFKQKEKEKVERQKIESENTKQLLIKKAMQ